MLIFPAAANANAAAKLLPLIMFFDLNMKLVTSTVVVAAASLPLSYAQAEAAQEMYYHPSNGQCEWTKNYTSVDYVTGACQFAFNHAKIINSNEPLDGDSGLFVLRYDAANWRADDEDATLICFPNNTVIYSLTPLADNITKADFDGDGFYYLKENLDTVADGVKNLASPGFFYAKDGIVDALVNGTSGDWNYTNAEGPNYLHLCDIMGNLSSPPSDIPSSAHKSTHWQSIAMVVQGLAFFAFLQ